MDESLTTWETNHESAFHRTHARFVVTEFFVIVRLCNLCVPLDLIFEELKWFVRATHDKLSK